jgi:hypothetical protein
MREQYDRLDQGLAQWGGKIGSSGRSIQSFLRGDPRMFERAERFDGHRHH